MKTIFTIFAAAFILSANILFAGSEGVAVNSNHSLSTTITLAPATPLEATFDDVAVAADILTLAPATPAEATFSDDTENMDNPGAIAPVTPLVADFE
jgi:hypothetical protein